MCICRQALPEVVSQRPVRNLLASVSKVRIDGTTVGCYHTINLKSGVATGWKILDNGRVATENGQLVEISDQLTSFELVCRMCDSTFFSYRE